MTELTLLSNQYRLPNQDDKQAARQLNQILARKASDESVIRVRELIREGSPDIAIPPNLANILRELLGHIASGNVVTMIPIGHELTTQEAADLLNVSRPHLIKLLEKGEIEFHKTGRHRRIKAEDLFKYREKRDGVRKSALEALAAMDADYL